jgi:hypothetical protein
MKAVQALKEWADTYARQRSMGAEISIQDKGNTLEIKQKECTETYVISPVLDPKAAKENATMVTLNNPENRGILAKSWEAFTKVKGLKVIFVNPFSEQEEKWIILPAIHDRICDRKSLKLGFTAMAELVDPITEEEIETR